MNPNGHRYEVDVFKNLCLNILECELDRIDQPLALPDFLEKEVVLEITGIKEFSNYNLAR